MYSVDIYLNRSEKDTENDLDSLRKQFNSKQNMDLINLRHKIYEYMLFEAQSQQPVTINLEKDNSLKIIESVCTRHYTINKNVIPGGLGNNKFTEKNRNAMKFYTKYQIFLYKAQIAGLKKQAQRLKGMDMPAGISDFVKICEILNVIFSKQGWKEAFKQRYPKEAILFN